MSERHVIENDWVTRAGYRAVALFIHGSHRTGYVSVPPTHPFFGKEYNQDSGLALPPETEIGKRGPIDVFVNSFKETCDVGFLFDVHGGITYSRSGKDYPVENNPDENWWFGFDCAHLGDLREGETASPWEPMATHKSLAYVEDECESLADQLKKYELNRLKNEDRE